MHGRELRVSQHFVVNIRLVFPCIEYVRMSATEQGFFIDHTSSRRIDDERIGFTHRKERLVAHMVGGLVQRNMERDNIAVSCDFIDTFSYSFRRIVEQNIQSVTLRHLRYQ